MTVFYTKFKSPICEIILAGNEDGLSNLHLQTEDGKREFSIEEAWVRNDDFFTDLTAQIMDFLTGKRSSFDVNLNPQGTEFQKKVWAELCKIPKGETRSYKEVAIKIGNKNASRAVGMANSKNPIPLIIPCHRVLGQNGSLTGFAHGLRVKHRLLEIESD